MFSLGPEARIYLNVSHIKSGEQYPTPPLFFDPVFVFFVAAAILPNTKPPRLRYCMMAWVIKATLTAMNLSFIKFLRLLHRPRARKLRNQAPVENPASTDSAVVSSYPTPPSNVIQHEHQAYYHLAQRLQQLSPPGCNWLGPDDVQIIDTAPNSSGSISEIWRGSMKGLVIAVKSLRCYSSPEFDPAEVGIVSLHRPARLG